MALLFCDGFDAYSTAQMAAKWTNGVSGVGISGGAGRLGYGHFAQINVGNNGSASVPLKGAPFSTLIVGFAFQFGGSLANVDIFYFLDSGGGTIASLRTSATGQLVLNNGSTNVLSSASGVIAASAWCYIEVQITFSSSATGSATLRVNGATVASAGTIITATGGACSAVAIVCNTSNGNALFDDLYVLSTVAPNNTFLGDIKIVPLYPAGNGRVSGFSRLGGSASGNWTAVSEVPPDGDTSYVYTATPGVEDAYVLTTLSNVATVKAVQLNGYARKDDTPSRVLALGVGNGSTENFDAGTPLNTTYVYVTRQLDTNPLTSAAWSVGDFSTLQAAVELIS